MTTAQHFPTETVETAPARVASTPASFSPEAEQKAQAKAMKKWRKNERLRFFFGWCSGCQAYGSIF
ncbi:hypothetical protein [Hymenobacter crusticola]|nr:hypothetical protein [Hymenobacter crusticola]